MHHIKTLAIALVGLGVLASDLFTQPAEDPAVDARADALLRSMSTSFGRMKTFGFEADHATVIVTRGGARTRLLARSRVAVERPGRFRSERVEPTSDLVLTYDRGRVMLYARRLNVVATGEVPDTLDEANVFARSQLHLEAPAAELISGDAYAGLMKAVVSGRFVGTDEVRGRPCHHLAYRGKDRDWQIWIEKSPRRLPCRYLVKRKTASGSTEDRVDFHHWTVDPRFDDAAFVIDPPGDAVRIHLFDPDAQRHARK